MTKRDIFTPSILLLLSLAFVCLVPSGVSAQAAADTPFRRTVIVLENNSDGKIAARGLSSSTGHFALTNVAEGKYVLAVGSKPPTTAARPKFKVPGTVSTDATSSGPAVAAIRYAELEVSLPGGKKVRIGYDIVRHKSFNPANSPDAKATKFEDFVVVVPAGGGSVEGTILRSRWTTVK